MKCQTLLIINILVFISSGLGAEIYSGSQYKFETIYNEDYDYKWHASDGIFIEDDKNPFLWTAPKVFSPTEITISISVKDKKCGCHSEFADIVTVLPDNTPINDTPINDTTIDDTTIDDTTIDDTTIDDTTINDTTIDDNSINDTPIEDIPVNYTSKDYTPTNTTPVDDIPVNDTPKDATPIDYFSSDGSSLDDFGMTDNASSGEMALESTIPPENSEPEVEAEPVAEKDPNDEIWSIPLDFGEGITVEVIAVENSPNTFAASVESVEEVAGSLAEDVLQSPANLESNSTPLSEADNQTTIGILNKTEEIKSSTAQNATELVENQALDQPGIDQKNNDLASTEMAPNASDEAGDQQDLDSVSLKQPAAEATPSNVTMGTPAESEIPSA